MTAVTSERDRRDLFRLTARVVIAAVAVPVAMVTPAFSDDATNYKEVGDIAVYLGVVPAALVAGHPAGHAEQRMHGGVPRGLHSYHILIAVFDRDSGERVSDATVAAFVSGEGHVGRSRVVLEPMTIADTITYGNFVSLPGRDRYTIEVEIKRPGSQQPQRVTFTYHHAAQ
jgi:uncharacterized protein involved in high-affinity Fe2+ transport